MLVTEFAGARGITALWGGYYRVPTENNNEGCLDETHQMQPNLSKTIQTHPQTPQTRFSFPHAHTYACVHTLQGCPQFINRSKSQWEKHTTLRELPASS